MQQQAPPRAPPYPPPSGRGYYGYPDQTAERPGPADTPRPPNAVGGAPEATAGDCVLLYGHLDKQPEMTGWDDDLGPWKPVIKGDKLYGRGGADASRRSGLGGLEDRLSAVDGTLELDSPPTGGTRLKAGVRLPAGR